MCEMRFELADRTTETGLRLLKLLSVHWRPLPERKESNGVGAGIIHVVKEGNQHGKAFELFRTG